MIAHTGGHTAATCPYIWCQAHQPDELCDCPYAQASPHRAEHCRYARATDDQDHHDHG